MHPRRRAAAQAAPPATRTGEPDVNRRRVCWSRWSPIHVRRARRRVAERRRAQQRRRLPRVPHQRQQLASEEARRVALAGAAVHREVRREQDEVGVLRRRHAPRVRHERALHPQLRAKLVREPVVRRVLRRQVRVRRVRVSPLQVYLGRPPVAYGGSFLARLLMLNTKRRWIWGF